MSPIDAASDRAAAEAFLLRLGRALHEAGAPSHRIEDTLSFIARRIGIELAIFTTPTSIFASFGHAVDERTALIRVEPAAANLERMVQIDGVIDGVVAGSLDARTASARLDVIAQAPERYGPWITSISFAIASATVARFLGGGGREVLAGTAIGLQTGLLAILASRRPAAARVFEWVASLAASLAAVGWAALIGPLAPAISAVAGLIVLVPGLTLTLGVTELATKNLVSGTARLAGAALTLLAIGFGLAVGARFMPLVGDRALLAPVDALPAWTLYAALVPSTFALTVLFRARPQDAWVIGLSSATAFFAARLGAGLGGGEVGLLAAAFLTGILANAYARIARRPSAVAILPAIILLVPGTLGVRSVSSLVERDVVPGVELLFTFVVFAGALTAGLLLANLVLSPRRSL